MSEGEKVTELTKQSAPTAKAPVVPQIETERWAGYNIMMIFIVTFPDLTVS